MADTKKTHGVHPVAAAAMGAVIGAAGGVAASAYLSKPANKKLVGEKFEQIKSQVAGQWDKIGGSKGGTAKEKASESLETGKKTMHTSGKRSEE